MKFQESTRFYILLTVCLLISTIVRAQPTSYFQQEVNTKIQARLDDEHHYLHCTIEIEYINNSETTLDSICMHLWPNAYSERYTAFGKQQIENGSSQFYRAKENELGNIDSLNFEVNGQSIKLKISKENPDLAVLYLNQPLAPGDKISLNSPFRLKIPHSFSRLGHLGHAYQLTQWYPKPAVYDKDGWHHMSYLDQGEFYSEFGHFDVSITVPENYVVGATGRLQNASELEWLNELAAQPIDEESLSDAYPVSSGSTKTLHFVQDSIHDFAWFADKRFIVRKGSVELPHSNRTVTTWAMFTPGNAHFWKNAVNYLNQSVYDYSEWLGDYPYDACTAVDGALSAGGGMEYPMITVIASPSDTFELDLVIAHEVGHNWFYGILGTNERHYPWMDEGLNTFYENRYVARHYPNRLLVEYARNKWWPKLFDIDEFDYGHRAKLACTYQHRRNAHQPVAAHSEDLHYLNYGIMIYLKTAILFEYLEAYLGSETYDRSMKRFFEEWKFRHPGPADLHRIFKEEAMQKLDFFFNGMLKTEALFDVKIKSVDLGEAQLTIALNEDYRVPFEIQFSYSDGTDTTIWHYLPVNEVPIPRAEQLEAIALDPYKRLLDIHPGNNHWRKKLMINKLEKLSFRFLGGLEQDDRSQLYWLPIYAWNDLDKSMLGLAIYNSVMPPKNLDFAIAPLYAFGSKTINGRAWLNYRFHPKRLQELEIGMKFLRSSYQNDFQAVQFNKLQPHIEFTFKNRNARSTVSNRLNFVTTLVQQEFAKLSKDDGRYAINQLQFSHQRSTLLMPYELNAEIRQGPGFGRLSLEGKLALNYFNPQNKLRIRAFGLVYPWFESSFAVPDARSWLNTSGGFAQFQRDYTFDEVFLDRSGTDPVFGKQVATNDGGFRSFTSLGGTDSWLFALNFSSDLHPRIPIKPFLDFAFFPDLFDELDLAAEFGASLSLMSGTFEIHVPFVTTNNIKSLQELKGQDKFYERITFSLNVKGLNPAAIIRNWQF